MEDKEAESKAEKMSEMMKKFADISAKTFEDWLKNHQDASKEEAHEQLVSCIVSASMMNTMMLGVML